MIYLYSKFVQEKFPKESFSKREKKDPWYLYAFFVAFSPIVVLCCPYILISDAIKNRKYKKRQAEKEEKKRQLELQKESAIKNFEEGTPISIQSDCIEKGQQLKNIAAKKDYRHIIDCLNHLHLPAGYELKIKKAEEIGMGNSSLLVVTTPSRETLDVFDTIIVDDSPIGAMEVYLLYEMWHYLPLFWHANYAYREYIYSTEDLKDVQTFDGDEIDSFVEKAEQFEVSPIVKKGNGKYYISCCYWTDWGGLIRELVEIEIKDNKIVNIFDATETTLYEYQCGIIF